ncbi:hypothetical protein ALC57_11313 [Trachymyrmex cornetzi]|uniref:Uncharacterized protein n=1 Tax=Trachymyrmex cornetzi TaxID=471704 RepID=A0A195DU86_9HYME|nr:hypothetical protein ALC57_11313 [Trachymyrmex cornetzi]
MEVEFGGGVTEEDILARLKAWRNDLQAKPSYFELAAGAEGGGFEGVAGSQAKINVNYEFCICIPMVNVYGKNRQVTEKIYLRVKNDVPEDGGAVLINSAQIYCRAMDQVSSMGIFGWIRDEVAIHFDIFTVRTVRLQE